MIVDSWVNWRGLELNADYRAETDFLLKGIVGWSSWEASRWTGKRPDAHGQFAGRAYVANRQVVLTGVCYRPESRDALFDELSKSLALPMRGGTDEWLTVRHAGRTLRAAATLMQFEPMETPATWAAGVFGWKIEFHCADVYRYETTSRTVSTGLAGYGSGALEFDLFTDGAADTGFLEFGAPGADGLFTLENPGSMEIHPVFTVKGPAAAFAIENQSTGQSLVYSGEIFPGQSLVLNDGSVLLDGVDRSIYLTGRQWWTVPAGGRMTGRFRSLGPAKPGSLLTVTTTGRHL
ncbi:MAG: hypothetical protein IIZ13_09765 [Renibacterium sp.]|nr:hypothetical protein [Renibacterium sp.]